MNRPSVSVVMPAYNASSTIRAALDTMCEQDIAEPWELIVVDNNSTDDTAAIARSYADRLPLQVIEEPVQGINAARNGGAAVAQSDKLVLADSDDLFGPGYVRAMRDAIEPNTVVGGWLDRRHLPPEPERRLDEEPVSSIFSGEWLDYPIGCCSGLHRGVFDEIGGYDPSLIYGGDDIDAYWRAQLAGASLVQAGADALVIRRERADPKRLQVQAATFGRAEAALAVRFADHGHPGRLRKRAWFRTIKWSIASLTATGADGFDKRRRRAYHGAAAKQLVRFALRLDERPPTATIRRTAD